MKNLASLWKNVPRALYLLLAACFLILVLNYSLFGDPLNLERIPFDAEQDMLFNSQPWPLKFILEFRPVVFSLTPLVLILALYFWIRSTRKREKDDFLPLVISLFVVIFFAAVIQQQLLNNIRYSIVLYPLLAILAGFGIRNFFRGRKISLRPAVLPLVLLALGTFSLYQAKPFYFNYTNFLLPERFVITDAWGYGGYEAAQYLNRLPDARNMAVWTDNTGVCEFFVGTCFKSNTKVRCQMPPGHDHFDYFVTSRRGGILFFGQIQNECRENAADYHSIPGYYAQTEEPAFELLIGGRPENFIRVHKSSVR